MATDSKVELPAGVTPALNTAEAAAYVRMAESTMEKLRVSGGGPRFARLSRKCVRYTVADLDAWLASRTVGSTSEKVAA